MAEIKSFREYIAERALLKEIDDVEDINNFNDDNEEPKPEPKEPKAKINEDAFKVYENFELKFEGASSSRDKVDQLENMSIAISLSYDALKRGLYMKADDFNDKIKWSAKKLSSNTYLNLTNSISLAQIKNEMNDQILNAIKKAKESRSARQSAEDLKKRGLFTYNKKKAILQSYRAAYKRGEEVPEEAKRIFDAEKKEAEEKASAASSAARLFKEDTIEEGLWRKFRDSI